MLNSLVTGQAPQVAKNKEQLVRSNMKQSSIIRLLAGNTELPRSELFITICSIHSSTQQAKTHWNRARDLPTIPQEIWMVSPSLGAISAHHGAQLPFTIPGCQGHTTEHNSTAIIITTAFLPLVHHTTGQYKTCKL
jgi:hypothetical protein